MIVTGKVVDEYDKPIKGFALNMYGTDNKFFRVDITFNTNSLTDTNGMYRLWQVIPDETDIIDIDMTQGAEFIAGGILTNSRGEALSDSFGILDCAIYFQLDSSYREISGSDYTIPSSDYGKTITLNYQLRKK